jgi:hypothetical protein
MADPAPIPSENCSPADGFCRTSPPPWSPCTKEQFGRGPTRVRSHFAGPDALLCVMDDALLPAEARWSKWASSSVSASPGVLLGRDGRSVRRDRRDDHRAYRPRVRQRRRPDNGVVMGNFLFEPGRQGDGRAS